MADCEGIDLPNEIIRALPIGSGYKYLGVLEAGGFQCMNVKNRVKETYKQRLQLILKFKLNGKNQVQAINSFAIPVICYMTGIIGWTVHECAELDRLTGKQLTLFKALHPWADVDRLYVSRNKVGRGLLSVADVVFRKAFPLSVCYQEYKTNNGKD